MSSRALGLSTSTAGTSRVFLPMAPHIAKHYREHFMRRLRVMSRKLYFPVKQKNTGRQGNGTSLFHQEGL